MKRRIYKKEDTIEVIFERRAEHFDKKELENQIVNLYGDIERWKNLLEAEIGYNPAAELEDCPAYTMPQINIKHYLKEDKDGILKINAAHRNKRVEEWLLYYKVVLKRKNPIRNIASLFEMFEEPLLEEEKDRVKVFLKSEKESLEI